MTTNLNSLSGGELPFPALEISALFGGWVFLGACLVIFLTHYLGAIGSYGSSMLALPLLVLFYDDLPALVLLLLLIGTVQGIQIFILTRRDLHVRELGKMIFLGGAGAVVGYLFLSYFPRTLLLTLLGLVLVGSGFQRLHQLHHAREGRPPQWLLNVLLGMAGVIHGAFASGGATLIIYAQYTFQRKEIFRATLAALWIAMNIPLIGAISRKVTLEGPVLQLAVAGVPLALLAGFAGHATATRIPEIRFQKFIAGMLVVAGVVTLWNQSRALWG